MDKTDDGTGSVEEIDGEIVRKAGFPEAHLASTINGLWAVRGDGPVEIEIEELARIEETTPAAVADLLTHLRAKMPGYPVRHSADRDGRRRTVGFLIDSLVPVMVAGRLVLQIVEDPNVR